MKKTNLILASLAIGFAAISAQAEDAYIESLGTSFMNTGYCVTPQSKVVVDFAYTDTTTKQRCIFGCARDSQNVMTLALGVSGDYYMRYYYGKTQIIPGTGKKIDADRHTAIVDFPSQKFLYITGATTNSTITIDDEMMATNVTTATMPLGLFSAIDNTEGTADKSWTRAKAKIYGCKIWENGTLVHDFRPCLRNEIAGFYDEVTDNFIYGNDPAAFTGGGEIVEREAPYIASDGTSFMNARCFPNPKTKVEIDFAYTDATTKYQRIIGEGTADGIAAEFGIGLNGACHVYAWYGDTQVAVDTGISADTARHTAVLDLPGKKISYSSGGIQKFSKTISDYEANVTKTATYPLALFSDMKSTDGFSDRGSWTRGKARIYRCRIWEDGTLVHDYKPCVKGGIAGFEDQVDGYLVRGENASDFTAGDAVARRLEDAYVSTPYNNDKLGLCGIDTGYQVKPTTKVVMDYMLLGNAGTDYTSWWYLFDARGGGKPFTVYAHGSVKTLYYALGSNSADQWKSSGFSVASEKGKRREITMDSNNKCLVVSTGGFTNKVVTMSSGVNTPTTSDKTLKLCTAQDNSARSAAMKIYGLKIYEAGELVYDYVPYVKDGIPGLYDKTKDSFITAMASSGISGDVAVHKQLMAGGNIEGLVQDAYLESDGTGIIKTDYYANSNTKIVADYMLLATNTSVRIAGYEHSGSLTVQWYVQKGTGSNNYTLRPMLGTKAGSPSDKIDFYRHTSTMDGPNMTYSHEGAGWNWTTTNGGEISGTCDGSLAVFGHATSPDWSTYTGLCKMRLYSLKIYESGELVRQYLPYQSGTTVGLKDTVTGNVLTDFNGSTTAFTLNGAGSDGSKVLVVAPKDTEVRVEKSATLSAFAAGATSYVWTVDGETSATTGDALTIPWQRRKTPMDVTCTPVFSIDGVTVKGETSTTTVTFAKRGMAVIVR